jgi:hypothetical protein
VPLSNDQLRAIGRISVNFNELEFALSVLLWALLNPSDIERGRRVFGGESFDRIRTKLESLSEHVFSNNAEMRTRISFLTKMAHEVQRRHNEVLHAIWLQEQPTGEMVPLRLGAKQTKQAGIRATELDALAGEIIGLQKAAFEILDSIPWPARRPPLKRR